MSFEKWHGMIRVNFHLATRVAHCSVSSGNRLRINSCSMGAQSNPPRKASKDGLSSRAQRHGYSPRGTSPESTSMVRGLRLRSARHDLSVTSIPDGKKVRPKRQMRRHPRCRVSGVLATSSPMSLRAWNRSARGSSSIIAGGSSRTSTTESVTISVFVSRWKKAVSPNAPTALKRSGPSVSYSISPLVAQEGSSDEPEGGRTRSLSELTGNPKVDSGSGSGNDH
mmetsp:Transcript_11370/g.16142  ORF Transcript_11370/g.16142 Transcript_11370/m.16142 type:complete len:224 (+) Transcript_11370:536-1207(+)|eukprot:scaffold227199_cov24-Tisochrysis_lutea.AAC.1